jgi:biopolymer transport protein ExbD
MAQLESTSAELKGQSFAPNKKKVIRIDMTPMVDLGFLLITFFVFTTTISKPTVTDLYMPKDLVKNDSTKLIDDLALTLLLHNNNEVYYYLGTFDDAFRTNRVFKTNYSTYDGIGKIIRQRQKDLGNKVTVNGKEALMLLIKPTSGAIYKNVVDAMDEVIINDVKKYAIVEPADAEINFLMTRSRQ